MNYRNQQILHYVCIFVMLVCFAWIATSCAQNLTEDEIIARDYKRQTTLDDYNLCRLVFHHNGVVWWRINPSRLRNPSMQEMRFEMAQNGCYIKGRERYETPLVIENL